MKRIFLLIFFVTLHSFQAQILLENNRKEILKVLENQRIAWNSGNIEEYMEGYWKSDSLKFIGKSGIRYGWKETLETYCKGYPTKEVMGVLTFDVISIESIAENHAFIIGKWKIERIGGEVSGYFSLIWQKIRGNWLIIVDHSS